MYNQGQLVSPSVDGSRPGYNGDRITVHLVNETGNPNHSGIYKTTNTKTGSVSYRGGFTRRGGGGRQSTKSSSTIEGSMGKGGRLDRLKVYDKINIDDAIVDVEQMVKN
jgi:hypothetical protein